MAGCGVQILKFLVKGKLDYILQALSEISVNLDEKLHIKDEICKLLIGKKASSYHLLIVSIPWMS